MLIKMPDKLERLIKMIYKNWKSESKGEQASHPDEETLVCFLEGRLPQEENELIKTHLISCDRCAEIFAIQTKLKIGEERQVPLELVERVKNLVSLKDTTPILEILLRLKEKVLELINTTGDVLVGQELMPAPVLRSRRIKEFKDEVIILKDFQDIRVEVKIENKLGQEFNVAVTIKEKQTQEIIKYLRVALFKDDLELESYLSESGRVTFEHVLLGKYTVEISNPSEKLALILLDIKI